MCFCLCVPGVFFQQFCVKTELSLDLFPILGFVSLLSFLTLSLSKHYTVKREACPSGCLACEKNLLLSNLCTKLFLNSLVFHQFTFGQAKWQVGIH